MANWNPFKKKQSAMKEFTDSVKELSSKTWKKVPSKAKLGLAVAGASAGFVGVLAASVAASPKLKKNDPRYKALKQKGYL